MRNSTKLLAFFICAALTILPAHAADAIPMLSGGVGADSAAQIKSREKEFNLKLIITLVEGDYVSGARVRIAAGGKELATHVADGPFFLARLPAGGYNLTLEYAGQTQIRKVEIRAGRLTTDYVRFKRDAGDSPAPRQ